MLTGELFEYMMRWRTSPDGRVLRDDNVAKKLKNQAHTVNLPFHVPSPPHDYPLARTQPYPPPPPQICPSDYRQHIIELHAFKNLLVILGFAFASGISHAKRQVKKKKLKYIYKSC